MESRANLLRRRIARYRRYPHQGADATTAADYLHRLAEDEAELKRLSGGDKTAAAAETGRNSASVLVEAQSPTRQSGDLEQRVDRFLHNVRVT
jgi:hypothetical protein